MNRVVEAKGLMRKIETRLDPVQVFFIEDVHWLKRKTMKWALVPVLAVSLCKVPGC